MFETGFPGELQDALHQVLMNISDKTYNNVSFAVRPDDKGDTYILNDGSTVSVPYRIYCLDDEKVYSSLSGRDERLIYDCIFTRSCDGYVREKHLRNILQEDFPEWCLPYIFRLTSEYVKEIVEAIYENLAGKDKEQILTFCIRNPERIAYGYARMVSYWNEFYRGECFRFHDYVGYKLYRECFGYRQKHVRNTAKDKF